jgi:hypothetical protein
MGGGGVGNKKILNPKTLKNPTLTKKEEKESPFDISISKFLF